MAELARHWSTSYRARLSAGYLVVVVLFAGAWAWSLFGPLTATVIDRQQTNLLAVANAGALVIAQPGTDADSAIERLVQDTDLRMTLVAADGSVIADSEADPATMENHGSRPEIATALRGQNGFDRRLSETQGTERIYVAVPASFGGADCALRVSESLDDITRIAASARRSGLILLGAALLVAVPVVRRLTAIAYEPIRRLSGAAEAMAGGDLAVNVPAESGDLTVLSTALTRLREQMRIRIDDLQAEQHHLRAVLDGMTDAVFLLHDTEIRYANDAAGRLFPTPASGWRSVAIEQARFPASVTAAITAAAHGASTGASEFGPDVTGRFLRVTAVHLNPTDTFRRTLIVISDITERTRVDRMRKEFVANASHELKTPAAAIGLLAESTGHAAQDGDVDQALHFASQIAEESQRLSRLVGDLLDLSRLEGTESPDSVCDVREVLGNALAGHRGAAQRRGLSLDIEDGAVAGVDLYVTADPTDVAVALDNLLDNAIKYTEVGGITVTLSAGPGDVRVSVSDTGIGIPAEDIPRIFERFYRVDRTRSRDSGGTGLGLALVRHVVERSGGSIEVSSAPGGGSEFIITLPRAIG